MIDADTTLPQNTEKGYEPLRHACNKDLFGKRRRRRRVHEAGDALLYAAYEEQRVSQSADQ